MLNPNINFPYPIIREYTDDYKSTTFTGDIDVNIELDGYTLHPKFSIQNDSILEGLKNGALTYAIEVQCKSTWYRALYPIKDNEIIKIDPQMVHEKVELTSCIIADKYISDFTNTDFVEEYQGIKFELNPGDVVAIGMTKTFDALYQNDIIKDGSSIVTICEDDSLKEIDYYLTSNVINIILPKGQYENYINCGYIKDKYKILNAILVIPVLVEAVDIIAADDKDPDNESEFSSYTWYKTIVAHLKRYANDDEHKYRSLLDKPFSATELLLGNNYTEALEFLAQVGMGVL